MKILVSGAGGGLGQIIIEQLLAKGYTVIATSKNAEKAKAWPFYAQVTYIPFNIHEESEVNLFTHFQEPDAMIHLAWDKLNEYKNDIHLNEILPAHKAFLSNLIRHGLKDITCVGTCYEYGLQEGELQEQMPSLPMMPYPQAKNLLRLYLEELQNEIAFQLKWPRVFYVFGAIKERKNLYTLLMDAILRGDAQFNMSGGEQIRDFLSPDEIAKTIVNIAIQQKVMGIINCCSGKPVKLKNMIEDFLQQNNYSIKLNLGFYPYPDYEPMETWGSVKKLNSIY
jgi:nucleoside-diphosphate-sugar epimerase